MSLTRQVYYKLMKLIRPVKLFNDPFIDWLRYCNAGMLHPGNIYCIDYAIRNLKSTNPVIEIGAFCGLSTNLIAYLLKKHGKKNALFSCDLWDYDPTKSHAKIGQTDLEYISFNDYIKKTYISNLKMFNAGNLPYPIKGHSADFFKRWDRGEKAEDLFGRTVKTGGPVSFAYIDGDHTYEGAKADFIGADRHLERGGYILFDDSADESDWEVKQLVKEVMRMKEYRLVIKNPNYLFEKVG